MIIECKNRDEWLKERKRLIVNASDAAAILGWESGAYRGVPRRTAFDVYVSKKTDYQIEDNDAMLLGRCLEDGISKAYVSKTGRQLINPGDYTIWVHDDYPWIGATLDRVVDRSVKSKKNDQGPLEIKHVGPYKKYEWDKYDVPLWLQIQLQIQMACCNSSWGAYCAVIGGLEIKYGDLDRNDDFFESSIPIFEEFKWRLENNMPPSVESYRHLDAVKRLYPSDNGETINLDNSVQTLVDQLVEIRSFALDAQNYASELEAKIKLTMGENTFGRLPDGSILSLKTVENKGYTKVVKPYTYRVLLRK